jgi:hypothetical protein
MGRRCSAAFWKAAHVAYATKALNPTKITSGVVHHASRLAV